MIRKIVLGATATALAFGGLGLTASPAGAKKIPFDAVGSASCSIGGKAKINPPLKDVNTLPSTTTAKIKGFCTGTTGNPAVTPTKLKSIVVSVGNTPGTCTGLVTPGTAEWVADTKWKASGGKLNNSLTVFSGITPVFVPDLGFDLLGGDTTGSYAGTGTTDAHAIIEPPDLSRCTDFVKPNGKVKAAKGVKKIKIIGGTITF